MTTNSKKMKIEIDHDLEAKFSEMRIKRSRNQTKQKYHEIIKNYFRNEQGLCDWILNLWKYAKYINYDDILEIHAFCNLELIMDY